MSIFELIVIFIIILGAIVIGYCLGYYDHGIKMDNAHLKIIYEKWGPLITEEYITNDYNQGRLDDIAQVFEWLREEDI